MIMIMVMIMVMIIVRHGMQTYDYGLGYGAAMVNMVSSDMIYGTWFTEHQNFEARLLGMGIENK